MTEEIPPEYFTDDGFKYVYPLAKCIGWTDEQIKEAFNEYNKIEIDGSRAGTSLRMIISDLYKLSSDAALIINKYNIPYDQINPEKNDLLSILITFDECKVPSVDIFYFFGCKLHGINFIDLLWNYRMGKRHENKYKTYIKGN